MTRGKIAIITKKKNIYASVEFDGDMYPEEYGQDIVKALNSVEKKKDYKKVVREFNDENKFDYDEPLFEKITDYSLEEMLDMSGDKYMERWGGSDYLYLKNLSADDLKWIDPDGQERILYAGKTVVLEDGYEKDFPMQRSGKCITLKYFQSVEEVKERYRIGEIVNMDGKSYKVRDILEPIPSTCFSSFPRVIFEEVEKVAYCGKEEMAEHEVEQEFELD